MKSARPIVIITVLVVSMLVITQVSGAAGTAAGWFLVPGGVSTDVAPCATTPDPLTLYLFTKGMTDKSVYVNKMFNNGLSWTGAQELPGVRTNCALAATPFHGRPFVFAKSLKSRIFMNSLGKTQKWSGWSEVPGDGKTNAALAAAEFGGKLYLFRKGTATPDTLYVNVLSKSKWAGWKVITGSGTTDRSPAVVQYSGKLHMFTIGMVDRKIYVNSFDGKHWSGFSAVPVGFTDQPVAVTTYGGMIYLFFKNLSDQKIYLATYNGAGWLVAATPYSETTDVALATTVYRLTSLCLFRTAAADHAVWETVYH